MNKSDQKAERVGCVIYPLTAVTQISFDALRGELGVWLRTPRAGLSGSAQMHTKCTLNAH
jgi:hypothetical protein